MSVAAPALRPSHPTTRELVLVPAIITLAVTLLRLVGELQGWSPTFFSRQAGGGGAVVGIVWLVLVFGVWFGWKLTRAGQGPVSYGRAIGFPLLGLVIVPLSGAAANGLGLSPIGTLVVVSIVFLIGSWIACRGWRELGHVLFVYALAARVPVAIVMLVAILGNWGTHYDVAPPDFPAMGPVAKWALIGLFPQLTVWVGFTIVVGMVFGWLGALVARNRPSQAVRDAA